MADDIENLGIYRYGRAHTPAAQFRKSQAHSLQILRPSNHLDLAALVSRSSLIMTSLASGLFKSLPKPKYTGEEEELPQHAQPRGPRVVGADQLDETQVVLRVSF